jgi:uncharacterized protein (TIGR02300 family)
MQDKSNLGTRYTCFDCGKKFYDLNKPEPVCPGCETNQLDDPTPDPRVAVMAKYKGSRMTAKEAAPSKEAITLESMDESTDEADSAAIPNLEDDDEIGAPPEGVEPEAETAEG